MNANDKVTLQNYFSSNGSNRIETIAFANGTVWDYATVGNKLVYNGTANTDNLSGASGVTNRINGLGGNDTISGADKADVLNGGAGNDSLSGGSGNDTLTGGTGNDMLDGGLGNDTYVFNQGDGIDTIIDNDTTSGNSDKLQFGTGITADTIQLSRSGNDLILGVNANDKVTLQNYFSSNGSRVETIAFANGTVWDYATVGNKLVYNGTANADNLSGASGITNRINGLDGNDTINGADKADVLNGGAGNDSLSGGSGNDTLTGGTGNDIFKFISPNQGIDIISDWLIMRFGVLN